ncbi:unnamed protein product [Camellia sinensis]
MHLDTEPPSWRRKSNQNPLDSEKKLESVHKDNYCSIAIAVATILNPLLRWRWIDFSRFDQKRLIKKHALGHRTTVLAKEIEPESIRFGEETRIRKLTNHDMSWYNINIWRFCSELCWHVKYSKNHRSLFQVCYSLGCIVWSRAPPPLCKY